MWQPIATAPTDGTEFLAYDSVARKCDVCVMVQFGGPKGRWWCDPVQSDGEMGPSTDEFGYGAENITHWMPLPEPPK
jgi:hypothetical protein